MHVGILTGGGDCRGSNSVIRAVSLALINQCGARVTVIRCGFLGLLKREVSVLDKPAVAGILAQGGTILGTHNRCDPSHYFGAAGADVSDQSLAYARELGLDALVARWRRHDGDRAQAQPARPAGGWCAQNHR